MNYFMYIITLSFTKLHLYKLYNMFEERYCKKKKKNHNIKSEEKVIKMYISERNQLNSY